jgi:hypothetical protein
MGRGGGVGEGEGWGRAEYVRWAGLLEMGVSSHADLGVRY